MLALVLLAVVICVVSADTCMDCPNGYDDRGYGTYEARTEESPSIWMEISDAWPGLFQDVVQCMREYCLAPDDLPRSMSAMDVAALIEMVLWCVVEGGVCEIETEPRADGVDMGRSTTTTSSLLYDRVKAAMGIIFAGVCVLFAGAVSALAIRCVCNVITSCEWSYQEL